MFEDLYHIVPLATDTLEQRRERILNRIRLQPPYTERFLRNQLDSIIGKDKYELDINYDKYQLSISSAAENQFYAQEISIIMGKILPCNMQYISKPPLIHNMLIGDTEINIPIIKNYRLGVSWNLGQAPFISRGLEEVIKVANVHSIQQNVLDDTAQFISQKLQKRV